MASGKKEEKSNKLINETTVGMAQNELSQLHGEAASQIIQAYKGVRYDSKGVDIGHQGRSLKDISHYSLGKGDTAQQQKILKSQAGFSAELLKEARDNKKAVLDHKSVRTRTTDGLGKTNHPLHDHVQVDEHGNVIAGTGSQMKFYGIDKKGNYTVVEKMVKNRSWDRYDVIDIPREQYDGAVQYARDKAQDYHGQAEALYKQGATELAQKKSETAKRYEEAESRLRKTDVTTEEAILARTAPEKAVVKEVISDSHKAGTEAAKGAVLMGASISLAQNLYAVITEDKPLDEAAKDVAKTTAQAGAVAYITGGAGTTIKSIMHTSEKSVIRNLSNTNVPSLIATSTVEIVKSIKRYASGEINEVQLLEEFGEKGVGMLSAGYCSAAGVAIGGTLGSVLPIIGTGMGTVVGGFLGSMIGYTLSGIFYRGSLEALKGARIAEERRRVIEEISRAAIEEQKKYQETIVKYAREKFAQREEEFSVYLKKIRKSIEENQIDDYIASINHIGEMFDIKLEFSGFDEIDAFMSDENTVFQL